jgi:NAD(P)H dehydrogenase (quinone)
MKILIVYAHPEPSSFNHALKEQAINTLQARGHAVVLSDLYAMQFNPVAGWDDFKDINPQISRQYGIIQRDAYVNDKLAEDIVAEQKKVQWCDSVLFQFPLWWFGCPAIMKGWCERILAPGFAYDKEKWFATGLLRPKKAMLSVTTQSPSSSYQTGGMHGEIDQYLKPIQHTLQFVGFTLLTPFVAYGVMSDDEATRKKYLIDFQRHLLCYEE